MSTIQKIRRKIDVTTIDIKKAELLSNELKCDIRVNAPDNRTNGKAFLIDTLPLTSEKTQYTVLQKDSKDSWVAMETTLNSNEGLTRQWRKKKKAAENTQYGQIPTYIMLVMTIIALIYFMWITISQKLIIFDGKDITLVIMGFMLFLVIEGLIFYYIHVQTIDVISFQSYVFPKMETYTIHFEGEIRSINALLYRGRFVDFSGNTNKYIFGYNASEIQGGLKDTDGNFFIDKIRLEVTERDSKQNQLEAMYIEIEKVNAKINTLRYSKNTRLDTNKTKDILSDDDIKSDEDTLIKDLTDQHTELLNEYESVEKNYVSEIENHNKETKKLEDAFAKKISKIIGEQIDERKKVEIVNADETISKLKNELARSKIQMLGYANSYNGVVDDYSDMAENVNDRVNLGLAHDHHDSRTMLQEQSTSGNGVMNEEGNKIDWNRLIQTLIPYLVFTIIFIVLINSFSKIIESLSLLDSWAIVGVLFGSILLIIVLVMIVSRLSNKGKRYSRDADSSYLVN